MRFVEGKTFLVQIAELLVLGVHGRTGAYSLVRGLTSSKTPPKKSVVLDKIQTRVLSLLSPLCFTCLLLYRLQALLINSANLMGGSSEPDGFRGFGRIHLEAGMPLGGEDGLALFVADSSTTDISTGNLHEYLFDVDADAGLDFRVTLCWIDPPASSISATQLVHNLDLYIVSPSGESYTMWGSNIVDTKNVNERVIIDADDVETGTWTVWVWSNTLTTNTQSYSLVVNGAISPGTGEGASAGTSWETTNPLSGVENDDDDAVGAMSGAPVVAVARMSRVLGAAAGAVAAAVFLA